ncbi:DUF7168 domain-containing protein [Sphingomonas sp. CCH15-F11]|uniref:DUF7168 domain-containing protein n=1 Tax=Sphingomonas sp. CCH15-F11 TaxID=1768785 RepID=UPI0008359F79|nr:DUF2786 domain-containing protein [Sphingomonas sp. CCH15-F11]
MSADDDRRRILIERIRKCLALAHSSNEHEAAAALAKAQALMREHGIDRADVAFDEATASGNRCQRPPAWEGNLLWAVTRAIPCKAFLDGKQYRFVGRSPSAELAAYAFTVLHRQLKRARSTYIEAKLRRVRPGRKTARADIFCEGWVQTVTRKIEAMAPPADRDEALVKHVAAKFQLQTIAGRDPGKVDNATNWKDYLNGVASGRAADLHRPMGAGAEPARLAS